MSKINFTLAMFRIYRILVQCLNRNKKMFQCAPIYLKIINDIKTILDNNVIEPFINWYIDKNPYYNSDAIRYIELYYKKGKTNNALCKEDFNCPVDTIKKFVERSMEKYDKEMLSKKDTK